VTSRPLKILHVITGLHTGGAEMMLLKVLSNMNDDAFQQHVVSLTSLGEIGPEIEALEIPVTALNMKRGLFLPVVLFRLIRLIRRHRPHVVQTWLYHADLLGLIAARLNGIRAVIWNLRCSFMGDHYYRGISGLIFRLLSRLSSMPVAIVANSHAGRELHERLGYQNKHWHIIGNGFDLERFQPDRSAGGKLRVELGLKAESRLIGLVARWDAIKGFDTFLAAANQIAESDQDAHFLLVGDGCQVDNKELNGLIPPTLQNRIHLLGRRDDIPYVVAALDILCCASLGEGFPNVVGEAMALGVPCVATDVGDCAIIIGDTGKIVAPSRPTEMAAAFHNLLALNLQELHALGAQARAQIEKHYAIEHIAKQYEGLYRSLAGDASSNSR
jgi:glycosyltransferase involved in cell wall biosynthesis